MAAIAVDLDAPNPDPNSSTAVVAVGSKGHSGNAWRCSRADRQPFGLDRSELGHQEDESGRVLVQGVADKQD